MPAKIIDNQDPKTKEYLAKIGEVVILFNHLEDIVDFWIWELINAGGTASVKQQIVRQITSPLNFEKKFSYSGLKVKINSIPYGHENFIV